MNKASRSLPLIVTLAAAGLIAVSFWLMRTSPSARAERAREGAAPTSVDTNRRRPASLTVDSKVAVRASAQVEADISGVLAPLRSVVVGAEVAGKVTKVGASEHQVVDKGALLVQLDAALIEAARARAVASLELAQATQRQAIAELRRQRDLAKRGIASDVDLELAETEERTSTARVAEARAAQSEADTRLDKTRITAPFAAVVNALDLEPGAYVSPGSAVAELIDLSEIELEVGVSDRQISALSEGTSVRVTVDVIPGETFVGTIQRPGRAPDANTRRYPIPIRIPNQHARLLPGMLATAHLELGGTASVLRVPRSAVLREFDIDYVFVLDDDPSEKGLATVERRPIDAAPVPFRPDILEIRRGLVEGERIALSGLESLAGGGTVRYRQRGGKE